MKYTAYAFAAAICIALIGRHAHAQGALAGNAFGGKILFTRPCNVGTLITVGPPRPGSFMLMPSSIIYPYRSIFPPSWVLGSVVPFTTAPCMIAQVVHGYGQVIKTIGTSLAGLR